MVESENFDKKKKRENKRKEANKYMNFASSDNYQNLIDLLRSENCTLAKVVDDPGFATALRNDSPDLINFLTQEAELQSIIEFALSAEIEETLDPIEYKKMMRRSMIILTSSSRKLQTFLVSNDRFIQYLHKFPLSSAINSSILCANYAKIIDFLICNSQRKFLESNNSDLIDTLISHIDNLSFQMLLKKICCDYLDDFNKSYDIMKKLLCSTKNISKIYTLTKIVNDKPSLKAFLNIPEFLRPLYQLVVTTYKNEPFLCTSVCNLLLIIINAIKPNSLSSEYEDLYGEEIDFNQPINYCSASIISLFPNHVDSFIERFFINQDQCTTQINQSIYEALRKKSKEEIQKIVIEHDITTKIMDTYQSYLENKVNGHYFQVVQLFYNSGIVCPNREQERWDSFIEHQFAPRYQSVYSGRSLKDSIQLRSQQFGHEKLHDSCNSPIISNSDTAINYEHYVRRRAQSHHNMSHIKSFISSTDSSSSSSESEVQYKSNNIHIKEKGLPPVSENRKSRFLISRSSNSKPHIGSQQATASSSSLIIISSNNRNDSTIINQQIHQQVTDDSIINEVSTNVSDFSKDPDLERKLMTKSLDPATMRSVVSGKFRIKIVKRDHDIPLNPQNVSNS